jgi:hypothetical protein
MDVAFKDELKNIKGKLKSNLSEQQEEEVSEQLPLY